MDTIHAALKLMRPGCFMASVDLKDAYYSIPISACENLLNQSNPTIREVARVIGLLVSSLPGVQFGELHYRHLERNKISALTINKGDYDALMSLSAKARSELHWWVINVNTAFKNIIQTNPDLTLTTDASNTGWGAMCEEQQTGGLWSAKEHSFQINYLEMKAVLFGLQSLCSDLTDKHIRIQSDNTTTVSYINAMGGIKSNDCNDMALQIWQWANSRNIWLSSCHIPGVTNVVADQESRNFDGSTEWSLNTKVFEDISNIWGPFQIDLFASRCNCLMPAENRIPRGNRSDTDPSLANPAMVHNIVTPSDRRTSPSPPIHQSTNTTSQWCSTPLTKATSPVGLQSLRQGFLQSNFSGKATEIILHSWSVGTQKQYQPYLRRWFEFCGEQQVSPYSPSVTSVLDFLVRLHEQGLTYTTLNTARSAISALTVSSDRTPIGSHPIVSRFMKGIYKCTPPMPRYQSTWDVQPVLSYL
ncbi:uncharacterized protein [Montipora foliosa]|uniref:uncharacterized protein n=1 Tax=Montipora foliosa TaxID=591990 RepID=UPI0035F11EC5